MVKVLDEANGKEFYMDGILKDNLDVIKPHVLKDWDMLYIFSGIEGGGKSTLAMQVGRYLAGKRFTIDHICFNPEDFMEKIKREGFLQKGDCLLLDEAFMINSRSAMSELNRQFLAILSECRQKQLFLLICVPNFFDLDKNLALWRSRGLFYIYHMSFERGYFKYYSYENKTYLYVKGKKFFNYNANKPDLKGRFLQYCPIDMEEYKARKLQAFQFRKKEEKKNDKWFKQRNVLIKLLSEYMSFREMERKMDYYGEKVDHSTLAKGCKNVSSSVAEDIDLLNENGSQLDADDNLNENGSQLDGDDDLNENGSQLGGNKDAP